MSRHPREKGSHFKSSSGSLCGWSFKPDWAFRLYRPSRTDDHIILRSLHQIEKHPASKDAKYGRTSESLDDSLPSTIGLEILVQEIEYGVDNRTATDCKYKQKLREQWIVFLQRKVKELIFQKDDD